MPVTPPERLEYASPDSHQPRRPGRRGMSCRRPAPWGMGRSLEMIVAQCLVVVPYGKCATPVGNARTGHVQLGSTGHRTRRHNASGPPTRTKVTRRIGMSMRMARRHVTLNGRSPLKRHAEGTASWGHGGRLGVQMNYRHALTPTKPRVRHVRYWPATALRKASCLVSH